MKKQLLLITVFILSACSYIETIAVPDVLPNVLPNKAVLKSVTSPDNHTFSLNLNSVVSDDYQVVIGDISLCNIYTSETWNDRILTSVSLTDCSEVLLPAQYQPAWFPQMLGCFVRIGLIVVWKGEDEDSSIIIVGNPDSGTGKVDYTDVYIPCRLDLEAEDMVFDITIGETPLYSYDGELVLEEITFDCSVVDYENANIGH